MSQSALATARQREIEERAIAVFNSQQVRQARAETLRHFQADRNASLPKQNALIQQSIEEHYFHAALMAVSETPDDPAFVWTLAHDHQWMGLEVPGSRFGTPLTTKQSGARYICWYRLRRSRHRSDRMFS